MCDEPDGYSSIYRAEIRRARKEYLCWGCRETIAVGDRHRYTFSVYDGEVSDWRHCMRCARMVDALVKKHRDENTGLCVDVGLDCGEVWKDPPPEIAALAFALPKDFAEVAGG